MQTEIQQVFYNPMTTFGADENVAIVWQNTDLAAAESGSRPYVHVSFEPLKPAVFGICSGAAVYEWLVQTSVYIRDGEGALKASRIADKLAALFPVKHKFTGAEYSFLVLEPANVIGAVTKPGWFFVPVQFRIRSIK